MRDEAATGTLTGDADREESPACAATQPRGAETSPQPVFGPGDCLASGPLRG